MFHSKLKPLALVGILDLCLLAGPVFAQSNDVAQLTRQAQYWEQQGRADLAADTWRKLLAVDANNADALLGLGLAAVSASRTAEANQRLQQLQQRHPNSAQFRRLQTAIRTGNTADQRLPNARRAAAAGNNAEAVRLYEASFEGSNPPASVALEYYQALAGTDAGWTRARDGLRRLHSAGGNPRASLAYAQVLTYRAPSRREGINLLRGLTSRGDVGGDARNSWRQALTWMGQSSTDAAAYREYLAAYPGDADIQARLDAATRTGARVAADVAPRPAAPARPAAPPPDPRLRAGFTAMQADNDAEAERNFSAVLQASPNNSEALGGLGSVRLRQQRFGEATQLLERAAGRDSKWRSALNSARYWDLMGQSRSMAASGDTAGAQARLRQAIALDGRQADAHAAMGALLMSSEPAEAERSYRRALELNSSNQAAIEGLAGLYASQGRGEEATQMFNRLGAQQLSGMDDATKLQTNVRRARAQQLLANGDVEGAQGELEMALAERPTDPWVRLDLARLYQQVGRPDLTRNVVEGLLVHGAESPESLYVYALMAREQSDWASVEAALSRIPANQLDANMRQLQALAMVQGQAAQVSALAAQGQHAQAQQLVAQLEQSLGAQRSDAEVAAALAGAWADAGNRQRALSLAQGLLRGRDSADARLQYASVLSRAGQDVELAASLRQLQGMNLTAEQQRRLMTLRNGYLLRQTDALREMGNLEGAYSMLSPVLAEQPQDTDTLAALARLYAAANQHPQALALYQRILQSRPSDVNTLTAAAYSASAQSDHRLAEQYLQYALQHAPQSVDVLTAAARIHRAAGRNRRAEQYYRQALAVQQQQAVGSVSVAGVQALSGGGNPFAGMRGPGQTMLPPLNGAGLAPLAAQPSAYPAAPAPIPLPSPGYAGNSTLPALPSPATNTQHNLLPAPVAMTPTAAATLPNVDVRAVRMHAQQFPVSMSTSVAPLQMASAAPVAPTLQQELQELRSEHSSAINAGAQFRARDGEAGLGRVVSVIMPVKAEIALGEGYLDIAATPILMDSGTVSDEYAVQSRFGAGPNAAVAGLLANNSQAIGATVGSGLYQRMLTDGDSAATRDYIQTQARSSGLFQRLMDAAVVEPTVTLEDGSTRNKTAAELLAERTELATVALFDMPLSRFTLGNDLSGLTIGQIGQMVLGNAQLVAAMAPDDVAQLRLLSAGVAADMTAAQFQETLYSMAATAGGAQRLDVNAAGVGLSVGYRIAGFHGDIGVTPVGFKQTNVVGGLGWEGKLGDVFSLSAGLARRAVTDSVLSYAGVEDPRTGMRWGGVVSTGARVAGVLDNGMLGGYLTLQGNQLTGENVADNTHYQMDSGFYVHAVRTPQHSLTLGLNLTAMGYDKNLSGYTFGHGGYFSPQRYFDFSVPVHWIGQSSQGNARWQVDASVGYQHFKADAAPYFPTDGAMQGAAYDAASIASTLGLLPNYVAPVYPEMLKTGVSFNFGAATEWNITRQMLLGARLNFSNARDYSEFTTGFYLRYLFDLFGYDGQSTFGGALQQMPRQGPAPIRPPF